MAIEAHFTSPEDLAASDAEFAELLQPAREPNRKERRDFVRSLGRATRLAYGFGLWRRAPLLTLDPGWPEATGL